MRDFASALLIPALMAGLLCGCQIQQVQTQNASPLQSFNASANIAQPADMALHTVQQWLLKSFPDTTQPVQAMDEQQGEIRAQIRFTVPCANHQACQLQQDRKITATLRIKLMPERIALNASNFYWQTPATGQKGSITNPEDSQQVKNQLQMLANSLFAELAIP